MSIETSQAANGAKLLPQPDPRRNFGWLGRRSITTKIVGAFVIATLVSVVLVAIQQLSDGLHRKLVTETETLDDLAQGLASQIAQLLSDENREISSIAADPDIVDQMLGMPDPDKQREGRLRHRLERIVAERSSSRDIGYVRDVFVAKPDGLIVLANDKVIEGRTLSGKHRDYLERVVADPNGSAPYVSNVLKNQFTTRRASCSQSRCWS
jgi:lipopolysaccharide export LptBFGC system permease protein LptF